MPDLGVVTDDTSFVGEHAGSGRFTAPALRTYVGAGPGTGTGTVTFTDGAHTVAGSQLMVSGGTIGGVAPNATLTISPAAGAIMAVTSIAALRALGTAATPVYVEGYYAPGDGGEGVFVLSTAASDNNGTIIVSAAGTYYREAGQMPVSVKWFGAKGDGVNNDTGAIQAAANTLISNGGVLVFPYGVYGTANTLSIPLNTLVEGNKSTLLAVTGFPTNGMMLINQNNSATTLTDHDIIVREMTFDHGSTGAGGGSHTINFAFTRNVSVEDCTFQCRGAGDAVALIGCYNTSIEGCSAYGFTNCAYDHWWGPTNARVVNCYAETVASAQMVNFNPESTAMTGSYTAKGFLLENCELVATGPAAIPSQLEPLGASTFVSEVTVQGNIFRNAGVFFRGAVKDVIIANNTFDTPLGSFSVITTQANHGGNPINVAITGNIVSDPSTSSGSVAAIVVWTSSAVISGNMVIGGSVSAIDTSSYTPVVIGNYNNAPTNTPNAIAQTAPMRLAYGLVFAGGDAGAVGDVSKHIRLSADGSGINYQSNQMNVLTLGSVAIYVNGTRQGYVDGTGMNGPFGQGTRYPGLFTTLGSTGLFQSTAGMVSNVPATGTPLLLCEYIGSSVGSITTNGSNTFFNTSSDYRMKTVTGLADGARIDALTVHEGYITALPNEPQALLLAHEVQAVIPHIVLGEKDAVDEEGEPVWQSLDYSKLIPDLIAKCQALERRLAALEGP
jgi:hypothetical protein